MGNTVDSSSGTVRMQVGYQAGYFCSDSVSDEAVHAICTTMGYDTGEVIPAISHGSERALWVRSLNCTGKEKSVFDCAMDGFGIMPSLLTNGCNSQQPLTLSCYKKRKSTVNGMPAWSSPISQSPLTSEYFSSSSSSSSSSTTTTTAVPPSTRRANMYRTIDGEPIDDSSLEHFTPKYGLSLTSGENLSGSTSSEVQTTAVTGDLLVFVRLVNGSVNRGRLELAYPGSPWGRTCPENIDSLAASVACRQMGFRWGRSLDYGTYAATAGLVWLPTVRCSGRESSLAECRFDFDKTECTSQGDAAVECYSSSSKFIFTLFKPLLALLSL